MMHARCGKPYSEYKCNTEKPNTEYMCNTVYSLHDACVKLKTPHRVQP